MEISTNQLRLVVHIILGILKQIPLVGGVVEFFTEWMAEQEERKQNAQIRAIHKRLQRLEKANGGGRMPEQKEFGVLQKKQEQEPGNIFSYESPPTTQVCRRKLSEISGERYILFSQNIIQDTGTGLEWYVGPDKDTTWKDARLWAETLSLDEGRWRLPTGDELKGLYCKGAGPRNLPSLFQTSGWLIWSNEKSGCYALGLFFDTGELSDLPAGSAIGRAFAVRKKRTEE